MNPVFLLGVVLLAGAVVYFVLQPILAGRRAPMGQADGEMTDAEAKRRVSLLALRDVEYDRETGKLDEHDYRELKRELSTEALAALSDEQAERRAREDGPANGALAVGGGGTRVLDLGAELRRVRKGLQVGTTCRSCGHVNPGGSRFCSSCGGGLPGGA